MRHKSVGEMNLDDLYQAKSDAGWKYRWDDKWKQVCVLLRGLQRPEIHKRKKALAALRVITRQGDYKPMRLETDADHAYGYWLNQILDGYHNRDIEFVRYSIEGMRLVIDEILRKDSAWQSQDKGSA